VRRNVWLSTSFYPSCQELFFIFFKNSKSLFNCLIDMFVSATNSEIQYLTYISERKHGG
jgi:hypothetical protein